MNPEFARRFSPEQNEEYAQQHILEKSTAAARSTLIERLRNTPQLLRRCVEQLAITTLLVSAALPDQAHAQTQDTTPTIEASQKETVPFEVFTKEVSKFRTQMATAKLEEPPASEQLLVAVEHLESTAATPAVDVMHECGTWTVASIQGSLRLRNAYHSLRVEHTGTTPESTNETREVQNELLVSRVDTPRADLPTSTTRAEGFGVTKEDAVRSALNALALGGTVDVQTFFSETRNGEQRATADGSITLTDRVLTNIQTTITQEKGYFKAVVTGDAVETPTTYAE